MWKEKQLEKGGGKNKYYLPSPQPDTCLIDPQEGLGPLWKQFLMKEEYARKCETESFCLKLAMLKSTRDPQY